MMRPDGLQFAIETARIAEDMKCEDIVILDLRGVSPVADFFVLASGGNDRQLRGAFDRMIEYGTKIGERPLSKEGYDTAEWLLLDYVDVVVHLFSAERRAYYDLELLWGDAPHVEWSKSAIA